jgi:hypothetical protein
MSARAEIIWVSRNRTISVLRFFEAIRRWLVHHLTCVRLWLYVKYLKMKQTRKIKPFKRLFFSPSWNYLRLHACRDRAETQPGLEFWSCNRLLCFNRILSLGRAEQCVTTLISSFHRGLNKFQVEHEFHFEASHAIHFQDFLRVFLEFCGQECRGATIHTHSTPHTAMCEYFMFPKLWQFWFWPWETNNIIAIQYQ